MFATLPRSLLPLLMLMLLILMALMLPLSIPTAHAQGTSGNAAATASGNAGFATRHARYFKADWDALPGWGEDAMAEALQAFRIGCNNLARREGWAATCAAASRIGGRDPAAARQFFEQQFDVLQLRQPNDSDSGMLTGYFEPLLRGSRNRGGAFVHPVYALPDDLLYLDARELGGGGPALARVRERNVEPVRAGEGIDQPDPRRGIYRLDVSAMNTDVRDKKIRVRLADDRIVLYPTRQEIERAGLKSARPIAWVDSAEALYTMQIQGSGKIQLPDGSLIRVAYAEQNGHPFLPKVSTGAASARADGVRTRGLPGAGSDAGNGGGKDEAVPANVQKLIDYFLSQSAQGPGFDRATGAAGAASAGGAARAGNAGAGGDPGRGGKGAWSMSAPSGKPQPNDFNVSGRPGLSVSSLNDPSYVFFRQIPDSGDGPIGALGVPLTAGRSVAVDPRTTPLGAPVFIASGSPAANGANAAGAGSNGGGRLMIAQDTGGAIRGPVRADYFWGFGRQAGARAFQTKDVLRMWVLVPKGLDLVGRQRDKIRTRGIGGAQEDECLIADPELCVDDAQGAARPQ